MAFARRLVHCEYVCGVLNLLEFHPHRRNFIYKTNENGVIEIVLPWTDQRLGMAVKTTGRNLKETREIAKILEERYGYL